MRALVVDNELDRELLRPSTRPEAPEPAFVRALPPQTAKADVNLLGVGKSCLDAVVGRLTVVASSVSIARLSACQRSTAAGH